MKRAVSLIFALVLALCLAAPCLAEWQDIPYVTDEAGVLSSDTVELVNGINDKLYDQCGAYLVVVFLDYFGETDPAEYTVGLFNEWGISDNAALLVAAVREGNGGISLGSAIDDRSSEEDMTDLLEEHFWPSFDRGDYDKAVTDIAYAMEDWFTDRFGVSAPVPAPGAASGSSSSSGLLAGLGIVGVILGFIFRNIFVILVFVLIIAAVILSDRRRYRGYYMSMGMPIPRYRPWYIFASRRPYRAYRAPRPPRPAPPPVRPSSRPGSFRPTGGRSSSFSGRPSRPSAPSRPSGGSFRGGSFRGGSGRSGGGFSGRR